MPLYICIYSYSDNNVSCRLFLSRYISFIFLQMYITGGLVKLFFNLWSSKISVIYNSQRLHIFHSINFDNLINRKNNFYFILINLYMTRGTKHLTVPLMHWNRTVQITNFIQTILESKVIEKMFKNKHPHSKFFYRCKLDP